MVLFRQLVSVGLVSSFIAIVVGGSSLELSNSSTTATQKPGDPDLGNNTDIFTGSWNLAYSDKFEEYLYELGVGYFRRKLAAAAHLTTDIISNEGNWTIRTASTFQTFELQFKLGVPFEEYRADGRYCNATITIERIADKGKMIHHQDCGPSVPQNVILRDFVKGQMILTLTAGPVVSTRIYDRITPTKAPSSLIQFLFEWLLYH